MQIVTIIESYKSTTVLLVVWVTSWDLTTVTAFPKELHLFGVHYHASQKSVLHDEHDKGVYIAQVFRYDFGR